MLQGSLDTFGLEDVVTFLAATQKSGRLHLNGDRGTGSLWFVHGDVVAAMAANVPLEADLADVVFELLRYARGEFSFTVGEAAPIPGPPHPVAPLLDRACAALEEWQELITVVPSPAHRLLLVAEPAEDQVVLDREQWRTVLAVARGCTVAELGETLAEAELPALRRVCDLLAKGLVEVLDPGSSASLSLSSSRPVQPVLLAADDPYRWTEADVAPVQSGGDAEPIDSGLLNQLGGLSPRAAQAVSEVASRGGDLAGVHLSMRRDEI